MSQSQIKLTPSDQGDARYYKRAFNTSWVWKLQHRPRRQIIDYFMQAMQPKETDVVLDLGTANLPEPLENIFEYYYPYKHRIIAAGTEDCSFLEKQYAGLKFVHLKPRERLPFEDQTFDIGFSNAVIEHVGSRANQAAFLRELLRVSRRVFITTPNRWFPFELHTRLPFLHWLPPTLFRAILRKLGFEFYAQEENLNLLSARDLLQMVPKENYRVYLKRNYFFGFPSNLMVRIEPASTGAR